MRKARILIAEDHRIVSEGLRNLLERDFCVVGIAENGEELLARAEEFRPDVALVDISMPKLNGLEATRRLRVKVPETKVVILSMHSDPKLVIAALRTGAQGYLLKRSAPDELTIAIERVLAGERYISPLIAQDVLEGLDEPQELMERGNSPARLTPRQREVLRLIAEGRTAREIAEQLNLSVKTVEFHKRCIMSQLGARSIATLVRYAIRYGLVNP